MPKLRELRELDRKLDENKISSDQLSGFIDDNKEYVKNGFNREAARILSSELKKIGLTPTEASEKIRKILSEFTSLESGIADKTTQLETLGQKVGEIN